MRREAHRRRIQDREWTVSVDFYPAVVETQPGGRKFINFAIDGGRRCGCVSLHDAQEAWVDSPPGTPYPRCELCTDRDAWSINLCNGNAADLCAWLGAPYDEGSGELPASELAALCRRRLWPEARNAGVARPAFVDEAPGQATIVSVGRDADYLPRRTKQLLDLCERSIVRFGAGVLMSWA
jgi:hypothetical protein